MPCCSHRLQRCGQCRGRGCAGCRQCNFGRHYKCHSLPPRTHWQGIGRFQRWQSLRKQDFGSGSVSDTGDDTRLECSHGNHAGGAFRAALRSASAVPCELFHRHQWSGTAGRTYVFTPVKFVQFLGSARLRSKAGFLFGNRCATVRLVERIIYQVMNIPDRVTFK